MNDELVEKVKFFLDARRNVEQAEKELKRLKRHRDSLAELVNTAMEDNGIQSIKIKGVIVYRTTKRFVNKAVGVHKSLVCQALREAGFSEFVHESYEPSAIRGFVNSLRDDGENLPSVFSQYFTLYEQHTVAVRKSQ